jgi:hypothetical protein
MPAQYGVAEKTAPFTLMTILDVIADNSGRIKVATSGAKYTWTNTPREALKNANERF